MEFAIPRESQFMRDELAYEPRTPPSSNFVRTPSKTGSFRRQLPFKEITTTSATFASPPPARTSRPKKDELPSEKVRQQFSPVFLEYSIMAEYNLVQEQKSLRDIFVIPSYNAPTHWFGVLFVKQGLYEGGAFRFDMFIEETYPEGTCPKVAFNPAIFHPQIHPLTGELDTAAHFPVWSQENRIWQILRLMKRSFLTIDVSKPLNFEAATMYTQDRSSFQTQVINSITLCKRALYEARNEDPHFLRFSAFSPALHGPVQKSIQSSKSSAQSLSWVKPGSLKPCTLNPWTEL